MYVVRVQCVQYRVYSVQTVWRARSRGWREMDQHYSVHRDTPATAEHHSQCHFRSDDDDSDNDSDVMAVIIHCK